MRTSARVPARRVTGTTSGGRTGQAGTAQSPTAPGGTAARAAAAVESVLTCGVLFVLVTAVRWAMLSPLSRALPGPHLQLVAVAVAVGATPAWAPSSP